VELLYFGIVTGFSAWVLGISSRLVSLRNISVECGKFREFLEIPDAPQETTTILSDVNSITIQNLSFIYENTEKPVLDDINLTVRRGERIAIVGENGAGKTTLIKLFCGLYRATGGSILFDGHRDLQIAALRPLFAAVFQDYRFLPMSVAENIALQSAELLNLKRVQNVLEEVGMLEKVNSLPQGLQTRMVPEVWKDAVNFSGGEAQRLLLARALYKGAPILILDEPTAALDPIAESKIYESYARMMQGKTLFFISHRLASTQFCDRILYLANGKIAEEGTHKELLDKRGDYWRMFEAQSRYYRAGRVVE
jgi:ATP-binding cassette subfamily B protein